MKKILVVDDEPTLLDLLNHLLSQMGHQVDGALDPWEAATYLEKKTYDLILLDIKMPLMDGKAFYLEMKRTRPHMADRVVFLTGDVSNPETLIFIKETGNLHLQKPFTIKEVKTLLQKVFQSL